MGQYTEGQYLHGSDGRLYQVRNGVPVTVGGLASPTISTALPTAQAELTGKNLSNTKTQATLPSDIVSSKNAAISSGIKVKSDQLDYNMKAGIPPGDVSKYGSEYIATLPPGVGDLTKEMLAGKYKGSITNTRNPVAMQAALAAAHATHGTFDAGIYDRRQAVLQQLNNPNSPLTAFNTALAHAGNLYGQAGDVSGASPFGDTPLSTAYNAVVNYAHSAGPNVKNYENSATKYASEEAKAYGQNTGGEKDSQEQVYSANLPIATKQALLSKDVDYYMGRIAAMAHGGDIPGVPNDINAYLTPDARAALIKLNPDTAKKYGILPVAPVGGNNNPPPPGSGGNTTPPGYSPPPTGNSTQSFGASNNGFNDTPDPQIASFWNNAIKQNTPYTQALEQFKQQLGGRNLVPQEVPDPGLYAQAAAYAQKYPNIPYAPYSGIVRQPLGVAGALENAVSQSPATTYYANHLNSLAGGIPLALMGDQGARYSAVSSALNPKAAFLGNLTGTIGGALGAGKLAEAAAPGWDAARTALAGDMGYGAVSGAAQNPDHPVMGAVGGMGAMGLGNAAGRLVLGPAARAALDTGAGQSAVNGVRKVGGMFGGGGGSFSPPAPLDPGQNMIFSRANGDPLSDIQNNLQDAAKFGLPYTLADADPRLAQIAGSATRKSPDVLATAKALFPARQQGQGFRAIQQINNNLAPVGDVPTIQNQILQNAQAQSAPLYDAAKSQPVPELTANPALNEIFQRPAAQTAIRAGWTKALNNGEDVGTLTYANDPDGNPVQYGNPSWNVIHYARQALDDAGETNVRQALDKQIASINPGFKAADAAYSGIMKGSDALQSGASATGLKVTPEQVQAGVAGAGPNLPYYQQGYASDMADQIGRQNFSGNPYNIVNGSLDKQAKLNLIYPQGAPQFARAAALEGNMADTANTVLGNSQTAARSEADKAFDGLDVANDIGKAVLTGGVSLAPDLAMTGLRRWASNGLTDMRLRMGADKANALSPLLFNPDPHANLLMLNNLMGQGAARQAYMSQLGAASGQMGAGMFGAPILYGMSQQ